jgi:hypothetical protein
MNSPEYQLMKFQDKKFKTVKVVETESTKFKIQIEELKNELETTKIELSEVKKKHKESLISRLQNIENSKSSVPIGTEMKICDTDFENPRVEGKVEHETKKFYVIGGKRYHKYGLKFFDMENGKVILENTRW